MKLVIIGHETQERIQVQTNGSDMSTVCVETRFPESGDVDLKGYIIKRIFLNHDTDSVRIFVEKELNRGEAHS